MATASEPQDRPPFDADAPAPHADWATDQLYAYARHQLQRSTVKGLWRAGRALDVARGRATDDEVWLAAAACYTRYPMPTLATALLVARGDFPGSDRTMAEVCMGLLYAHDPSVKPRRA